MDVLVVVPAFDSALALRPLAGRPLVGHAVEQSLAARRVTRVVVVGQAPELARMAADWGVDWLSPTTAGAAEMSPAGAVADALAQLGARDGFAPMIACVRDPACPLGAPDRIDAAIDHLLRCGADTLISVHRVAGPLWERDAGGIARRVACAAEEQRFVENGAIVAVRVALFEQGQVLPAGRVVLYEVPQFAGLRLAADDDWLAADALCRRFAGARAQALLKRVKLLALDFDGVMTDNRVLVFEDGREAVLCSRGDGMGFDLLRATGLPCVVISKEENPVVTARCRKLKLPVEQGVGDKLPVLQRYARERGVELAEVAFFGNDINDLECMRAAGVAIAPHDAHPSVRREAAIVTAALGGIGAVREVCDLLVDVMAASPAGGDAPHVAGPGDVSNLSG